MKAYPIRGVENPFDEEATRNNTDSLFTVRVGYKIRRQFTGQDGEVGYMHDPHGKVIDLELNAGSDANAVALACEHLEEHLPQEVDPSDRVEIIDIRIMERPTLPRDADDLPLQAGPPPAGDPNQPRHLSNSYNEAA